MIHPRILVLVFVAVVGVAPFVLSPFSVTILNYIGLYSLATLGLVLLTGVGGLTSFGQAAFAGLGAYSTAWLTAAYGLSPWLTLVIGLLFTLGVGSIIGFATLKLSGHYLPLATIAWAVSLYFMFGNLQTLGGHTGMGGLPPVTIGTFALSDNSAFYYLIWVAVLGALWLSSNLLDSRPGRAMRALKGGIDVAEAMGVNTQRSKLIAFLIAAGLASVSGWLYAHMQRFVNPTPFGLQIGIEYLFMAVLGGAGHIWGAVLGAGVVTLLKQKLQDVLPHLAGSQGNLEGIAFGLIMVLVLQRAKDGLWPWIARVAVKRQPRAIDATAADLPTREKVDTRAPLLQVDGVSKRFGGLTAVRDMSLDISRGEILGLLGPNGAGKSTMFNLIAGSLGISGGTVTFNGERIDGLRPPAIARRGISRTFQHVRLLPDMTVLDNVALGAHLRASQGVLVSALHAERGREEMLMKEAARQIARVGLGAHINDLAGSLSLGQQRILEIARALAADPLLLLLDEPAAGLRLKEKEALSDLLKSLRSEGLAILLVEHDMDFVMNLVDRLVVMSFGEKIAAGTPVEVQQNERVIEAYLGSVA
ncbi:branched-chain amino acid ABC transporter ATP-binding protein/permease [Rhodopseudomonas sp. RCAM05734]|uniref:branched-chain amino acid ABC transporter ATP-binding protein/permease n=1 Tax=Rhodopseudomonas sp. RCAM05734 TaxID=3457549 RepID=UPI004043C247